MALKADLGTLKQGVNAPNAYLRIEEMRLKALPDSDTAVEVEVNVAVYVNKPVRTGGGDPIDRRRFVYQLDDTAQPLRKLVYDQLKSSFTGAEDA